MNEIMERKAASWWKFRKAEDCRDYLHFQEGKDYMLNFQRIM
jgi:hypothetical protein